MLANRAVRRRSLKIAQRRGRRSVKKKEFWKHGITKRDLFRLQHAIGKYIMKISLKINQETLHALIFIITSRKDDRLLQNISK